MAETKLEALIRLRQHAHDTARRVMKLASQTPVNLMDIGDVLWAHVTEFDKVIVEISLEEEARNDG